MHEATRKLLGVLLREMDGFDRTKRSVVIGATNRKLDLDPALLSRFDTVVDFPLPDNRCRCAAAAGACHCGRVDAEYPSVVAGSCAVVPP